MSADFWAGYISGAIGILVGNPLDLAKTRLQAGSRTLQRLDIHGSGNYHVTPQRYVQRLASFAQGAAAPIVGYGALNALLFVTYNRSLALINTGSFDALPEKPSAWSIWTAGALGGFATFLVSAPTELVKCRAQVCQPAKSSIEIALDAWRASGLRGLYLGGTITSIRDAVGYGFYYELSKDAICNKTDSHGQQTLKVLLCGGLAGVVTWASIFPLDVIKTRLQTWDLVHRPEHHEPSNLRQPLLRPENSSQVSVARPSGLWIAQDAYRREGLAVFFKGLGICSVRAFIVNAVQWVVYEWTIKALVK